MSLRISYSTTIPFTKLSPEKEPGPIIDINKEIEADFSNTTYLAMRNMYNGLTACSSANLIAIFKRVMELTKESYLYGAINQNVEGNFDSKEGIARYLNDFLTQDSKDEVVLGIRQEIKKRLIEKVDTFFNHFDLSELVITAGALEFLECRDQALFTRMRIRLLQPSPHENEITLKMLSWMAFGFRNKSSKDLAFFDFIAKKFTQQDINRLSDSDLVRLARGFTYARFQNRRLFDDIGTSACERNFTANEAIDLYWSYAYILENMEKRGGYGKNACRHLIRWLKHCIINSHISPSSGQLSRLAWCDKRFGISSSQSKILLDNVKNLSKLKDYSNKEFVTFFVSRCQDLSIKVSTLNEYVAVALKRIKEFSSTELTQIAYGILVILCARQHASDEIKEAMKSFLMEIFSSPLNNFDAYDLTRIGPAYQIYIGKYPNSCVMPDEFTSAINDHFNTLKHEKKQSSNFHKAVEKYLRQFKDGFTSEYFFFGFSLDIAYENEQIAIEVDGDIYHKNQKNEPLAKNRVKETLLDLQGWRYCRVSSSEWESQTTDEMKICLLKRKLRQLQHINWRRGSVAGT